MKDIFERFKQYKESVTLFEGEEDKVLHQKSIAIMKMLSQLANTLGVGDHVYVVGGAVRNFVINKPIKDIDLVIDSIALGGRGSDWFADNLIKFVNGTKDNSAVDQYGVAIVSLPSDFEYHNIDLSKEVIEIANARTEKYGGDSGKGYKPSEVIPASIEDDVMRREFTFNTLMWKLSDLQNGPENAEIVDLTGKGLTDLENGVMRTPAAPDKTFSDDPSRLIRAIKFKLRYDFDIDMETLNSIKKNAHKIKNIPSDAVSKILINDVFLVRQDVSTLEYLKEFNLLGPLTELCHENQQFHSTLNNWSNRNADLDFMFAMRDYGFKVGSKVNFLGDKVDMFRSNVKSMTADEADEYLMALKQPGRIIDTPKIKQEFNIKDSETKKLMQMAANIMLKYPEKYNDADFLEDVLRKELK